MNRGAVWLVAVLALVAGISVASYGKQWLAPQPSLPILDTLGGDFSLPSTLGRQTALSDFRGKLVLINFGFTSCPDVCPTVLARINELLNHPNLREQPIQPLFISVDPARDSIAALKPYLAYFHPSLIGLTGTPEQISQVGELFKVYIGIQPLDSELGYSVVHSDHIYLLDQQGRVRATFANNVPTEQMASTISRLLSDG